DAATPSTVSRCDSAQPSAEGYRSATRSNHWLNRRTNRLIGLRGISLEWPCAPSISGSNHTLDNIGSSVKETKSETSTANATVTPNWKKILPMIPPMNATGTKTATTASDVETTASPISS